MLNTDTLDYFPVRDGFKPSSMGLRRIPSPAQSPKDKIFQIDEHFDFYRTNKIKGHQERTFKYYQFALTPPAELIEFICKKLCEEYPEHFSLHDSPNESKQLNCALTQSHLVFGKNWVLESFQDPLGLQYTDAFDALAMQVPEDLVFHEILESIESTTDAVRLIHLCHANGWSAEGAIHQTFDHIHGEVPNIAKIIPSSHKMMAAIVKSTQSLERIGGINFRTSSTLNRHPSIPPEIRHVPFDKLDLPELYLRFERQTVTGFPNLSSFLFTIRTHITNCHPECIGFERAKKICEIFYEAQENINARRFIAENKSAVLAWYAELGIRAL